MKMLNEYFELQKKIYEYFGYVKDWVKIPLADHTGYYWKIDQSFSGKGNVISAEDIKELGDENTGDYYEDEIYTQRFLPKWVYRGPEYTMICIDTHCDGNKFLAVFDNAKEIKEK